MREILFRGKRTDNGEWVYGYYTKSPSGQAYIHEWPCGDDSPKKIDEETVGQYTGLLDANGKKIFEGDVVRDKANEFYWIVNYMDGRFWGAEKSGKYSSEGLGDLVDLTPATFEGVMVIGNIYDEYTNSIANDGQMRKSHDCAAFKLNSLKKKEDSK